MSKNTSITFSDLQGLTGLIKDATVNITDLVEDMHIRTVHPPLLPSTPIQHMITGISSVVYSTIRGTTKFIGGGLEQTFKHLDPLIGSGIPLGKKESILAVLNGVVGDHLVKNDNPLAIDMQFRHRGERLALDANGINQAVPKVNGKILLMVHGLCMNDLLWTRNEHNHGETIAEEFGFTPVHLHYNSGLHISDNGQKFSDLLDELLNSWPVDVEELVIVAHSMGGLVSRSAMHYGQKEEKNWTKHLRKIIFLGTPHQGAPLERIGNYVDRILSAISYVKPFARLGKMRSSGITDLRFGNLVEEDWAGQDRFKKGSIERMHIPLPDNVKAYAIAACLGKEEENLKNDIVGDGLVRPGSALGQHKDPDQSLYFDESNTRIDYETSHMDLLSSEGVYNQLKLWLADK